MKRLRVVVLGEGRDERGPPRAIPPFHLVPRENQGAMEILVRRKLYGVLKTDADAIWHASLDDSIDILQPPATRRSMVEVLVDPSLLGMVVHSTLKTSPATLLVATHDAEDGAGAVGAVTEVNRSFNTHVPLLQPSPEIQAWLTSKRAVERVYHHEHCTVPEVHEAGLKADAKQELLRLLAAHHDKFSAERQARLAEVIALEDVVRFGAWNGWNEADSLLQAAWLAAGLPR